MVPTAWLTIDETLYPVRNQIGFRQFNPSKPAKYGLLFKSLNSAEYPYTYSVHAYCGKPKEEPNEYYTSGTTNYVKYLVNKVEQKHSLKGRNISMDRLYNSIDLSDWLLSHKITSLGTMMHNRVGIPKELKDVTGAETFSSEIYYQKDGNLKFIRYVVKKKKSGAERKAKAVIMITTLDPLRGITDDDKKKPASIKLYDFTKGGTDIIDQKMGSYTVKPKSNDWTMTVWSYLMDTIRVNAQTLYSLAISKDLKKINSYEFGKEMGM